jgi:hypothetical protein
MNLREKINLLVETPVVCKGRVQENNRFLALLSGITGG